MICHILHFEHEQQTQWGVLENNRLYPLAETFTGTADFLENGRELAYALLKRVQDNAEIKSLSSEAVNTLSPVTKPCKVLCQGANYRQHIIESGGDPDSKSFNMFFNKSSASVSAPSSDVVRPPHVELLDYEVELGIVIGKSVDTSLTVDDTNLHELVAGIVIGNDYSARDVQFSQSQFFKAKSYRTFCPVGPVLCLLEKEDMHYLSELDLELAVNGNIRQKDSTTNIVFKPSDTLSEFTEISDLDIGDLILTGTPHGCALQVTPELIKTVSKMPEAEKWKYFSSEQQKNGLYLEPGDTVETSIRSADGRINLGTQKNTIRS